MSFMSVILRFARQVVSNVLSQLTQQLNVIQEQAHAPMKAMVADVVGGIWIGKGADAFVEEVSNIMLPGVGRITDHITKFHGDITGAINIMDQADEQVTGMVNGLADIFDGIYNG